jgi:hypothetical protein
MPANRVFSPFSSLALAAVAVIATGCPNGDVGAPCNHGSVTPPNSFLVTFPALSCNDLLCVYGEDKQADESIECSSAVECNPEGGSTFQCDGGKCKLSLDYVLERSMCSKRCESDEDCNNSGTFNKPAVGEDDTACDSAFKCIVLQRLGEFCCEKLCVCDDDLPNTSMLSAECQAGKEAVCSSNM